MAKQGDSQTSQNTMYLLFMLGGVVLGALWTGWRATAFVFRTARMSFQNFIATLFDWRSATVWKTKQSLPHPLEWHLLGAGAGIAVLVAGFIVFAYVADRRQKMGDDLFSFFGGGAKADKNSEDPAKWFEFNPKKFRAYLPTHVIEKNEVRPRLKSVPKKERVLEDYGLLLGYAKNDPDLPIALSAELSVLVVGEPRSGKTAGLVIPWVASWRGPLVTTSTRNEVMSSTLLARKRISERVYALCLPGAWIPEGVEPISYDICWFYPDELDTLIESAQRRASVFAEATTDKDNEIWGESVEQAFAALLLIGFAWRHGQVTHKKEEAGKTKPSLFSFDSHVSHMHVLKRLASFEWAKTDKDIAAVHEFLMKYIPEDKGQHVAEYVDSTAQTFRTASAGDTEFAKTITGLISVALGKLNDPQIAAVFSTPWNKPIFDPDKFLDESGTLYLMSRGENNKLGKYFSLVVNEISEAARRRTQKMTRCDPPLALILDEVANIAPLPNLRSFMSEGGGTGITTVAIIQNRRQLVSTYGLDKAEDITSSANVIAFFGGSKNVDDLAMFTAMAGSTTVHMASYDDAKKLTGRTESVQSAIDADKLANMKDGWMYVRVPGAPVAMVKSVYWFAKPSVKDRGGKLRSVVRWSKEWGGPYNEETHGYPFHGVLRSLSYQATYDLVRQSQQIPLKRWVIDVPQTPQQYPAGPTQSSSDKGAGEVPSEADVLGGERDTEADSSFGGSGAVYTGKGEDEPDASYIEDDEDDEYYAMDNYAMESVDEDVTDIQPEDGSSGKGPVWPTEMRSQFWKPDGIDRLFGSIPKREEGPEPGEEGA